MHVLALCLTLATQWSGGISTGGWFPIEVDLDARTLAPSGQKAQKIEDVVIDGARVRFTWPEEGDAPATFDGTIDGQGMEGTFAQGETRGRFWLARAAKGADFDAHRGLYEREGRLLWVGRMSEVRRQPAFIDAHSGRFGILYPESANASFVGRSAFIPFPVTSRFVFGGNSVTRDGVTYRRADCCDEEEVTWQSGAATLSGTLIKPRQAKGPVPLVVMLHGSGGAVRTYFSSLPYLLAHRGIASLVYDKRGSGKSSGNRHTATFYDLADDATRGAQLLAARPDIDARRIGVYGHSQGGWIAPLAAFRWSGFRFAVSAAGPAVTVDEEIRNEKRAAMRAAGLPPEDARSAMRAIDLYFDVRLRRATWDELARAIEEAKGTAYDRFIFHPKSEADVLRDLEDYDPEPVLRSLRVPLLALYGGKDPAVTPEANAPLMRRYNRGITVRVFEHADHDFFDARQEYVLRDRYAEGYLQFLVDWITARGGRATATATSPARSTPRR